MPEGDLSKLFDFITKYMIPSQDYQKSIDAIKGRDLIPTKYKKDVILDDYRELPIEKEFQSLFNFFQGNIYKYCEFGIEPGIFFFNTTTTLNAFAAKWKDHFIISFNKGTVIFLDQKFKSQTNILKVEGLEDYIEAESKSDYPLNKLMYQLCNYYIFYHELGHLIQKSDGLDEMLNEDIVTKATFNIQDHILEYDADLFSSICLGTHLYQYIDEWSCPKASDKEIENIISSVTASIFLLLLSFNSAKKNLYFEEESHPHPIIRIIGILYVITDYIELLSKEKKVIVLDRTNITQGIFEVAEKIADRVLYGDAITNFKDVFMDNTEAISSYNMKLLSLVKTYTNSAYNRRNEKINKQK